MHLCFTFNVGDVDVELAELLTSPLDALVDGLHDLLGVLLHPADQNTNTSIPPCLFTDTNVCHVLHSVQKVEEM